MNRVLPIVALAALLSAPPPSLAQEGGVGYGGAKVQLQPMMVPTRNSAGDVRYEVLTVRVVLDAGERERPGCFSIPYVHEAMLTYLYHANLTPADLIGQRQEVLAKNLLEVAIKTTDRGFYSAVEIVNEGTQAMDPKSQTLSNQCK